MGLIELIMLQSRLHIDMKTKICRICKKKKSVKDFYKTKGGKFGVRTECKFCSAKNRKIYYKNSTGKWREQNLKYNYGITLDDYNKLFNQQNGCCAICKRHQSELKYILCVEHNHQTNEIRGLTCKYCNWLIGQVENKILTKELLEKVINYLKFCKEN